MELAQLDDSKAGSLDCCPYQSNANSGFVCSTVIVQTWLSTPLTVQTLVTPSLRVVGSEVHANSVTYS